MTNIFIFQVCRKWEIIDPLPLESVLFAPLYLVGILWLSVGLCVITEQLLCPALENVTHGVDPSFSSAIIFGAFTSSPALCATLITSLTGPTSSSGVGAVVGGCLFNQTICVAISILAAMREELQLLPTLPSSYSRQRWVNVEPYSILRDLAAVAVAEIFVIYFTSDCDVSSLEAILLLSLYLLYSTICYITSAAFDGGLNAELTTIEEARLAAEGSPPKLKKPKKEMKVSLTSRTAVTEYTLSLMARPFEELTGLIMKEKTIQKDSGDDSRKHHIRSLVISLTLEALLVLMICIWSEKFGCLTGLTPFTVGVIFVGTSCSMPTLLISRALATQSSTADTQSFQLAEVQRRGTDLAAALSNSLGSNVFTLLVGLGLPWLFLSCSSRHSSSSQSLSATINDPFTAAEGEDDDLSFSLWILLGSLGFLSLILLGRGWEQGLPDVRLHFGLYAVCMALLIFHDMRFVV